MDNEILFNNLKKLRKSYKLTQDEVAAIIGKDRSLIAKYESGKAVPPLSILKVFAKLYNVSVDGLCSRSFEDGGFGSTVAVAQKSDSSDSILYSDLSEKERELILKLRLLSDEKANEIYESLSGEE